MRVLAWNCRGLGDPRAVRALKGLVNDEAPDIIFLLETKCKTREMEVICRKLGQINKIFVDCCSDGKRRRGGLAIFWRDSISLVLKSMSPNHIDLEGLGWEGNPIWRITGIYGYPNDEEKHKTWSLIANLNNSALPWLCFGDFNEILAQEEKKGGLLKPQAAIDKFRKAVNECNFRDLGYTGYPYTWSNNRSGEENVQERLDRFLANDSWFAIFPWCRIHYLLKRCLLYTSPSPRD